MRTSNRTRVCCAYVRTEEGRAIRKVVGDRENFRHRCLEPRTDGCSNVLSTVLKDNPIMEYYGAMIRLPHGYFGGGIMQTATCPTLNAEGNWKGNNFIIMAKCDYEYTEFELTEDTLIEPIGDCIFRFAKPDGETRVLRFDIRKLTPRECFRLMDVDDADIDKIQAAGISNSQQYKMAGNSIVTNVLAEIFRKLFVDTEKEYQSGEQMSLF